jgi:hypothetical protein
MIDAGMTTSTGSGIGFSRKKVRICTVFPSLLGMPPLLVKFHGILFA